MQQTRDLTLDVAKGICIILMVIGHSGCPAYLYDFIYMFHMPCFFFISGWLLNDKYLSDLRKGLYQKTKSSYYPFVKWTLIFLLFHNVFASLHIYDTFYSFPMFVERIVRAFTMTGSESLLGGFWFLISLFWASIGSLLFLSVLQRYNKLNFIGVSGGVISILLIASLWHYLPIQLPQMFGEQTLLATAFYLSGYLCRKMKFKFRSLFIFLLLIPALAACFIELNMGLKGWLTILDYIIAIFGILGVICLSYWISKQRVATAFSYVGNKTLYILIFHFLAFKIISALYLYLAEQPIEELVSFPVLSNVPVWMWLVYSVTGVILSLLLYKLLNGLTSTMSNYRRLSK